MWDGHFGKHERRDEGASVVGELAASPSVLLQCHSVGKRLVHHSVPPNAHTHTRERVFAVDGRGG